MASIYNDKLLRFPERDDLSVMEAITESKRLMMGHKWKMFCLELSFIGWDMLGVLTFGIGFIWITPYIEASRAAFYKELTGHVQSKTEEETSWTGDYTYE